MKNGATTIALMAAMLCGIGVFWGSESRCSQPPPSTQNCCSERTVPTGSQGATIPTREAGCGSLCSGCVREAEAMDMVCPPTWEQNGSSFIVTIWKDMWTTARLREVGVTNRQMLAMPTLKTKHEMAVAEYMELTGVTRNTATADLVALAKAGIVKRIGAGRGATYILQKCTINAQNAQSSVKEAENGALPAKNSRNKAKNGRLNEGITGHGTANDGINEGLNDGINEGIKFDVFRLVLEKPGCRVPFLTRALSVSRATVERAVAALITIGKIAHCGSKKTGGYYVVSGKGSDNGLV